ncbi:MAG TPA: hypothetical protein VFS66_13155 [Acidimicrobiia bacterium]|nr:hypothetical protein [Acidimicrobiia bacterium]
MSDSDLRLNLRFGRSDAALVYRSLGGVIDALMAHESLTIDALERMSQGLVEVVDAIFLSGNVASASVQITRSRLTTTIDYTGVEVEFDAGAAQIADGAFDEVDLANGSIRVVVAI